MSWTRQLHLYEVPFYYIEYAMAQLGALAVWKNYQEQGEPALTAYLDALKLGYTRTVPEIYERAGCSFNFGADNVREQMQYLFAAYEEIEL